MEAADRDGGDYPAGGSSGFPRNMSGGKGGGAMLNSYGSWPAGRRRDAEEGGAAVVEVRQQPATVAARQPLLHACSIVGKRCGGGGRLAMVRGGPATPMKAKVARQQAVNFQEVGSRQRQPMDGENSPSIQGEMGCLLGETQKNSPSIQGDGV